MDKTYFDRKAPITAQGLMLVILVHAIAIWALSSGLGTQVRKLLPTTADVNLRDTERTPPPPPPPTEPPTVRFDALPLITVPVPVVEIAVAPDLSRVSATVDGNPAPNTHPSMGSGGTTQGQGTPITPSAAAKPMAQAGAVCSQMGRPELPALHWQGVASFKVHAQLAAGRVSAVNFVSVSPGLDGKTRRQMQRAIETALLETYRCQDSGSFEQEFVLRVED